MPKRKPVEPDPGMVKIASYASIINKMLSVVGLAIISFTIITVVKVVAPEMGKFAGKTTDAKINLTTDIKTDNTIKIEPTLPEVPGVSPSKSSDKKEESSSDEGLAPFLKLVIWSILVVTAVASFLYARAECWFRRRKVSQVTDRLSELERVVDPDKSSSGLLKTGATHPRDKP